MMESSGINASVARTYMTVKIGHNPYRGAITIVEKDGYVGSGSIYCSNREWKVK